MFVDFASMARELGTRADALRIQFGIPTRLQQLIRGAATFEEITALAGEFRQEDRFRSCGPKFEEVEKEDYRVRRAELFPAYLARFTTIENFFDFGIAPHGDVITQQEEEAAASKKLCKLFGAEIDEKTEALLGDELERLVEIHDQASRFVRKERAEKPRVSSYEILAFLQMRIWGILLKELEAAKAAKNTAQAVLVFKKLKDTSAYDLHRYGERYDYWRWLWTEAASLEDLLLIEKEIPGFIDRYPVEGRIAEFVRKAVEGTKDFSEALALARQFAGRDDYQPSEVYSYALVSVTEKVRTVAELRQLIGIWQIRGQSRDRKYNFQRPELPKVMIAKWDTLFLAKAKVEQNFRKLAKLMERSPWGSETRQTAENRLEAHFEARMAQAASEEEIDQIEEEAKALSRGINLLSYSFKRDLENRRHAERVQALWAAVERGEPIEEEKKVLVGLYHEFKESDLERAHTVLLRLARHFPAEVVDEVPTEV